MTDKEAIDILSDRRDYYFQFADGIDGKTADDAKKEALALDNGVRALKMQEEIRKEVKDFSMNWLNGKYQLWSVGASGMASILNKFLTRPENIENLNHIGWKGVKAKFIKSNNDMETIWACPNCKKEFLVKQMRPGLIQKRDLADITYCSKCGAKFNWEDE